MSYKYGLGRDKDDAISVSAATKVIHRAKPSEDTRLRTSGERVVETSSDGNGQAPPISLTSKIVPKTVKASKKSNPPPPIKFKTVKEAEAAGFKDQRDDFFENAENICMHTEPVGRTWFRCTRAITSGSNCANHGEGITDIAATERADRAFGITSGKKIRSRDP